ncbi:hypothetical protein CCACVL1_25411 [Corchorus capsularis]|uniref:Uncharacterized protein n=1 Tax=Corchorus capsularis TaxID=210143 RepID=A0A1R3GKT1_COCAP|nr:hypothetical protein CCACVL1_25411 [Corchorus capsularis]
MAIQRHLDDQDNRLHTMARQTKRK